LNEDGLSKNNVAPYCNLTQPRFFEDLWNNQSDFVSFESFTTTCPPEENCFLNAEIQEFRLVFRASDGSLLPKSRETGKFLEVKVSSTALKPYKKYVHVNREFEQVSFIAPKPREFLFSYHTSGCVSGNIERNTLGLNGTEAICIQTMLMKRTCLRRSPFMANGKYHYHEAGPVTKKIHHRGNHPSCSYSKMLRGYQLHADCTTRRI